MQQATAHAMRCNAVNPRIASAIAGTLSLLPGLALAATAEGPAVMGIPVDFILFAITLV